MTDHPDSNSTEKNSGQRDSQHDASETEMGQHVGATDEDPSAKSENPPAPEDSNVHAEMPQAGSDGEAKRDDAEHESPPGETDSENTDSPAAKEESAPSDEEKPMTILEHLAELRRRICFALIGALIGFFLCYGFSEYLFNWLCYPLIKDLPDTSRLIYTGVAEGFFTHVKIALVAGIFIGSPLIFYQFWAFVAPGLYEEERRYIVPIALCSALFFISGAAFGYTLVFPMAFEFFMSYNTEYVVAMPKLSEYLDFSLQMLVAFGVVFEMPLVAFFLARMGVLTVSFMRRMRRYAILGIFIIAAVLTPPDVISQLCMAAPLLILYEFSILVVKIFSKRRETAPQTTEEEQQETAQPPVQGD